MVHPSCSHHCLCPLSSYLISYKYNPAAGRHPHKEQPGRTTQRELPEICWHNAKMEYVWICDLKVTLAQLDVPNSNGCGVKIWDSSRKTGTQSTNIGQNWYREPQNKYRRWRTVPNKHCFSISRFIWSSLFSNVYPQAKGRLLSCFVRVMLLYPHPSLT